MRYYLVSPCAVDTFSIANQNFVKFGVNQILFGYPYPLARGYYKYKSYKSRLNFTVCS